MLAHLLLRTAHTDSHYQRSDDEIGPTFHGVKNLSLKTAEYPNMSKLVAGIYAKIMTWSFPDCFAMCLNSIISFRELLLLMYLHDLTGRQVRRPRHDPGRAMALA